MPPSPSSARPGRAGGGGGLGAGGWSLLGQGRLLPTPNGCTRRGRARRCPHAPLCVRAADPVSVGRDGEGCQSGGVTSPAAYRGAMFGAWGGRRSRGPPAAAASGAAVLPAGPGGRGFVRLAAVASGLAPCSTRADVCLHVLLLRISGKCSLGASAGTPARKT